MKLGGAGLISFRRLIRACKTETLRLTDRYQQLCSQTPRRPAVPLEGCQDPAAHPCPWHGHCCEPAVDLLRSAFGPEKVSVHPLDPNWDPGPIPLCPPCLLATCSFHAWPRRGFPAMDVVLAVLQSPDIPPALLEETTKTKQEPALFRGECFHPVSAS